MKNVSIQNTLYPQKKLNKSPKKEKLTLKTSGEKTLSSCGFLIKENIFSERKTEICSPIQKIIIVPAKKNYNARDKVFSP